MYVTDYNVNMGGGHSRNEIALKQIDNEECCTVCTVLGGRLLILALQCVSDSHILGKVVYHIPHSP